VAWSPDGRRVLTTAWSGPTGVFDLAAAELALELPRAASADVIVVETERWERVAWPAADESIAWPEALAFHPDGDSLAVMTRSWVHLVDLTTSDVVWSFSPWETAGAPSMLARFSWSPAGTELVLAAEGGELWFVDPAAEAEPGYLRVPTSLAEVQALAHSSDGSLLVVTGPAATGDERRVTVLDATTLDVRHDVPFASGGGRNVAVGFAKDDAWFWAAGAAPPCGCPTTAPGEGDVVKAWGVADGARVFGLANPRFVSAAAFSPDATRVAAGSAIGSLSLWAVP
jgi:WD40 repeat protein